MSEPTGTQYGGFWVRFLALLVDSAIVFLVCAALLVGAAMALGPEELMPAALVVWLLGLLYWPVMHASGGQATFGKAILGLKVARFDGRRISILRALWREIAKIFSAAVLMLGYLMAGFTPRKQGLHDLMAATYVMREGSSHAILALVVAIAGFALPVVVGPMVADPAAISKVTGMAEGMVSQQDLMKQLPGPARDLMKQAARPAAPGPKAAPKPKPPAPVPVAKAPAPKPEAPAPKPEAPAPKPEPIALAQPADDRVVETVKPATKSAKPKAEAAKPKPAAPKAVAKAGRPLPPPPPPSTSKAGSGPRYNDIMTAVLYGDAEGVNELLKLGKWPDKPDRRGVTPLMVAAERGDVRTAEALLRGGADARLAVPVAEQSRHGEMILLLKRYAGR
jgi:uncharacterized RDD family membrane protein YckC